jgi:hypothetical protein
MLLNIFKSSSAQLSPNVPVINDVFLRPIRKNAKHFFERKKMWRRKNPQRRLRRLDFFVA